jgi:hypothetical protein
MLMCPSTINSYNIYRIADNFPDYLDYHEILCYFDFACDLSGFGNPNLGNMGQTLLRPEGLEIRQDVRL